MINAMNQILNRIPLDYLDCEWSIGINICMQSFKCELILWTIYFQSIMAVHLVYFQLTRLLLNNLPNSTEFQLKIVNSIKVSNNFHS